MKYKTFFSLTALLLASITALANAKDPLENVQYVGKGIIVVDDTVLIGTPKDLSENALDELYVGTRGKLEAMKIKNMLLLHKLQNLKVNKKALHALKIRCKELKENDQFSNENIRNLCKMLEQF